MAGDLTWQTSLRQMADVGAKRPGHVAGKKAKVVPEPEVVDENDFVGAKASFCRPSRRRSTKGSLSELPVNSVGAPKSPAKKSKAKINCQCLKVIPAGLNVDTANTAAGKKPIPSPVFLPAGVTNIDPWDDGTLVYGRSFYAYVMKRDRKFVVGVDDVSHGLADRCLIRNKLAEWIVEVAHYCRCSQETLYHTVDIMDRTMASRLFDKSQYQLLAMASFLIATKLDEYYPADIDALVQFSDDSYGRSDILAMERTILAALEFETYGAEPMVFVNRIVRAAQMSDNVHFVELVTFFMDTTVVELAVWSIPSALKAAASVLAALAIFNAEWEVVDDLWTVTLRYYSCVADLAETRHLAEFMLKSLVATQRASKHTTVLKTKYSSASRHNSLLLQPFLAHKLCRRALLKFRS